VVAARSTAGWAWGQVMGCAFHPTVVKNIQGLNQCPPGADAAAVASSWQPTEELVDALHVQVGRVESTLLHPSAQLRQVIQLADDRARRVAPSHQHDLVVIGERSQWSSDHDCRPLSVPSCHVSSFSLDRRRKRYSLPRGWDYADPTSSITAPTKGGSQRGRHNTEVGMTQVVPTSAQPRLHLPGSGVVRCSESGGSSGASTLP
jgi:hypothetical protein